MDNAILFKMEYPRAERIVGRVVKCLTGHGHVVYGVERVQCLMARIFCRHLASDVCSSSLTRVRFPPRWMREHPSGDPTLRVVASQSSTYRNAGRSTLP